MNNLPKHINDLLLTLDEPQLRELNDKVVERLKLIDKAHTMVQVSRFNIGDNVYFDHNGRRIVGNITRLNQKTVSIKTKKDGDWRVAPGFLKKFF